jgi:hypothetical protein
VPSDFIIKTGDMIQIKIPPPVIMPAIQAPVPLKGTSTDVQVNNQFAGLLTQRRGGDLDAWITTVRADDLPALRRFTDGVDQGLRRWCGRADAVSGSGRR